jgi:hypothetical protein
MSGVSQGVRSIDPQKNCLPQLITASCDNGFPQGKGDNIVFYILTRNIVCGMIINQSKNALINTKVFTHFQNNSHYNNFLRLSVRLNDVGDAAKNYSTFININMNVYKKAIKHKPTKPINFKSCRASCRLDNKFSLYNMQGVQEGR